MSLTFSASSSDGGECFLSPPKRPNCIPGTHSLLDSMYWPSSAGIKQPGPEPSNSPASGAEVMMLSTIVQLGLRFQLNEQQ